MNQTHIHKLSEFLYAVGGSFRNSICIDCGDCPHGRRAPDILLTTDYIGRPILIPASAFQKLTGMTVDKTECVSVIERRVFEELYSLWLKWVADSTNDCQLRQAVCRAGWEIPCNT